MERPRIAILGGGAAGLAAALTAAKNGADVFLCEKNARVGKKLLLTGNGRCNLTNLNIAPFAYNRPDFAAPTLEAVGCGDIRAFFYNLGLWTYADECGRVYPVSGTATSVLDVLRLGCARSGVRELCAQEAVSIELGSRAEWKVRFRGGEELRCGAVVVCTGGGTKLLESAGHRIRPFEPVLCPIAAETAPIRNLNGLRVRCRATLLDGGGQTASERGEILFRDYGVSGIAAFDLSRFVRPGQTLSLDLMPELSETELAGRLLDRDMPAGEALTGIFHRRVAEAVLRCAGSADPRALARLIKDFRLSVVGKAEARQAQVTRGGADVSQFDAVTLASRLQPGLFAAGEALDIDGRCGGYNLHWAFASGITAGGAASCLK